MDAMGLSNKKPNTVSTSHSGSFAPNNPDLAKAAGIVSALPRGPQLVPASQAWPHLRPLPCCPRAHPGLFRLGLATAVHGVRWPGSETGVLPFLPSSSVLPSSWLLIQP